MEFIDDDDVVKLKHFCQNPLPNQWPAHHILDIFHCSNISKVEERRPGELLNQGCKVTPRLPALLLEAMK